MQNIIDQNLPIALRHIETRATKEFFIEDVGAKIENIDLRIEPKEGGWDKIQSDLFFD